MRAARLIRAGAEPGFEIQDLPEPVPAAGEVVVQLVTAAFNRRDWWIWNAPATPVPVTLGSDGAGRVIAVGAGVEGIAPGATTSMPRRQRSTSSARRRRARSPSRSRSRRSTCIHGRPG
jgi:NADPH:quinone reductase-like Zn-dependent oxidoreductase